MGLPPSAGVVNAMVACALPGVAAVIVGVPGGVPGATGVTLTGDDGGPVPALLVAATVQE